MARDYDDILVDSYEWQITDEPPDSERHHGSLHRGAAGYDPDAYPPWGSSHGQEGGSMTPFEEELVVNKGGSYDHGVDVLGASAPLSRSATSALSRPAALASKGKVTVTVPKRAVFALKPTPAGNKHVSMVLAKPKHGDDKSSIKNARDAAKRAISVGNKLKAAVAKAEKKSAAKKSATKVHGVVPTTSRLVGKKPKVKLSHAQILKVAKQAIDAGNQLKKAADKHESIVKAWAQHRATMKSPRVFLHGEDGIDELELHSEMCGAYLDMLLGEGEADMTEASLEDAGTSDGAVTTGYPGPPDYGYGPAPTIEDARKQRIADAVPDPGVDTDTMSYSSDSSKAPGAPLPVGYVLCDWSRGTKDEAVGSWARFYRNREGFDLRTQGWWGGAAHHDPGWMVYRQGGKQMDTVEDNEAHTSKGLYVPQISAASLKQGFGPLVGNAWYPETVGLRYDAGGDQWFWYGDKAPPWATQADDQKLLNQMTLDYKSNLTAAAADAAARAAADQLEAEQAAQLQKQQAAEDAATQRQMDQENAQAQHEADLQAKADEAAHAQAAQQADIEAQQQMAQAQAQAELERQRMLTQAEVDRAAVEQAAQLEMQAAQYEAMQPPADEEYAPEEEGPGPSEDELYAPETASDLEQALLNDEETVLGSRAIQRLRARKAKRHSR